MHKDCADRVPGSLHNSFGWPANAYYLRISSRVEQRDQDARTSVLNMRSSSPNRLEIVRHR